MSISFDAEVDAVGLNCPLPILKTKKAMAVLSSGQVVHIMATDPGAKPDFEAFAKQGGHQLLENREENGTFHFVLRKA